MQNGYRASWRARRPCTQAGDTTRYEDTYNLQLDALSVQLDGPDLEVYADGGDERGGPCVIAETQEET